MEAVQVNRWFATLAGVLVVALRAAGCSSGPARSHSPGHSGVTQVGAGSVALAAPRLPGVALRLGYVASPDDGIALAGIADGVFRSDLGDWTRNRRFCQ